MTDADSPYVEPPRGNSIAQDRADATFRRQLLAESARTEPLTEDERRLLDLQRRNPGVLLPEFQQIQLDRAIAEQRRQAAESTHEHAFAVQDRIHNPDPTVVARRGIVSRQRNRQVADPHLASLRPVNQRPGPHPWDDEPQCLTIPSRNVIPWRQ